ncbi:MAG TPA: hypothetical protein P5076_22800, partial [Myxococcota bacterium]|nr:hypothetical protein [Myxococcota bacterium]
AVVGLVQAESAEQARAAVLALKAGAPSEDPSRATEAGPKPNVALPTPCCHCSEPAYKWE